MISVADEPWLNPNSRRELVLAAIAAGKHVYSEWPLGRDMAEVEKMAAAARAANVHTAIGLQLRGSPVVKRTHDLIASGAIGRILTMSAYSATAGFGPDVPAHYLYLENPANFANLITIQGAHTIDLAVAVAGPLAHLNALASSQYPRIKASNEKEDRERVTFDHLLLQSCLVRGSALSIEVSGGRPPETPFRMEIVGEIGVLRLDGGAPRGFQSGRLKLSLNGTPQTVDEASLAPIPDAAANVAGVYASLRDDLTRGAFATAGFDHAVKLTRLITDLLESSRTGIRVKAADWPET
jgi:predicted dehydrogenase